MAIKSLKKLLNFKKQSTDNIVYCVVGMALVFLIGKSLLNMIHYHPKIEGYEGQKELLLLHMDGCPHCVKLMPHWDAASKENKSGVKMRAVERKEPGGDALCKKHNVTGFPTILLLGDKGNKLKTYQGPRTKGGLLDFMSKSS